MNFQITLNSFHKEILEGLNIPFRQDPRTFVESYYLPLGKGSVEDVIAVVTDPIKHQGREIQSIIETVEEVPGYFRCGYSNGDFRTRFLKGTSEIPLTQTLKKVVISGTEPGLLHATVTKAELNKVLKLADISSLSIH